MKLIYVWIDNYKNFQDVGFNLSSQYYVNFDYDTETDSRKLVVRKIEGNKLLQNPIEEITAIIGKNGSGKTNIIDLLGMRIGERKQLNNAKYFILYNISDNTYAIEGSDYSSINKSIVNFPDDVVSEPFSMYLDNEDGNFTYKGFLQFNYELIDTIHFYNFRSVFKYGYTKRSFEFGNEFSTFFSRVNLTSNLIGYYSKYNMITFFNNISIERKSSHLFNSNNQVFIELFNNILVDSDSKLVLKKSYKRNFREIIKSNSKLYQPLINNKLNFIMNYIEDYIQFSFSSIKRFNVEALSSLQIVIDGIQLTSGNDKDYYFEIYNVILVELSKQSDLDSKQINSFKDTFYQTVEYFEQLDGRYFAEDKIKIPISNIEEDVVREFLQFIDKNNLNEKDDELNYLNNSITLSVEPLSSGEEAFINLFASLYYGLKRKRYSKKHKAIILLDEPDNFMHPEWSRILISELIGFLSNLDLGYSSYQIILTTHSPFIISDLLKSNVIALDKDSITGRSIVVNFDTEQTFASNIHTLLSDEFFMSSTIGEYAISKINEVISLLRKSKCNFEELAYSKFIIDSIGDPLLKEKLMEMYLSKE